MEVEAMYVINVLLLITGFAGAIIAVGGDTWLKGKNPLLERITARGWLSILLMVIALALGVYKELRTKSLEASKDAESQTREKLLQSKLDDETIRLVVLQSQATTTANQLTLANKALAEDKRMVGGIAEVEKQIHGQVDAANEQISIANQNLLKSGQVLDAIGGLQTQIRDVSLLTALSKSQNQFNIEVRIPIRRVRLSGDPAPKTVIDLIFPRWQQDGIQDPEQLLLGLELESFSRPLGRGLMGSMWGFRKNPYDIKTFGSADVNELSASTNTDMKMYGDAKVISADNQSVLVSTFRFPKTEVPGQWLSEFRTGTKVFTAWFAVRNDLDSSEMQRLIDLWNRMFSQTGSFRIPLLDQDNFFMEYQLGRGDAVFSKEGQLSIVSFVYSVTSPPTFHTRDL